MAGRIEQLARVDVEAERDRDERLERVLPAPLGRAHTALGAADLAAGETTALLELGLAQATKVAELPDTQGDQRPEAGEMFLGSMLGRHDSSLPLRTACRQRTSGGLANDRSSPWG